MLDQQGQIVCLSRLSSWFGLSRSSNYYQLKQINKDELLKEQVLFVLESNPSYGHRRIALALGLGKRRVRRVMKLFGIKAYKRKRNWRKRRGERRPETGFPNLVKGICPIRPNLVWVTDFTYLRFKNSFIYLCTFMDLFTRRIVGWSLSARHTKQLIIDAFFDAFQNTETTPRIVHSDQGVEYTNKDYIQLMTDLRIRISMSQKASPWQNGYQESFYHNFKTDLGLEFDRFDTIGQFVEAVHQTINYYNHRRIHTSLKMSPSQFYLLHQIQFQQLSKKTGT